MANIPCTTTGFPLPSLANASIISLAANLVQNYTASSPAFTNPNHPAIDPVQVDFCNVTILHKHDGHDESISTQIWLPATTWNERIQALGGGGYIAGISGSGSGPAMSAIDGAIAEGYVAASTNAGLWTTSVNGDDADKWFLADPSKPNYHQFEDFAHRSLGDMASLAKQVVKSYYGREQKYAYFSGCSNGGRQGLTTANRYPEAYDGIAGCAPGLYWDQQVENFWAQQLMMEMEHAPFPCELEALSAAALDACDEIDGVKDGVMQDPDACTYDPWTMLNKNITCTDAPGGRIKVSEVAVRIAEGVWTGKRQPDIDFQMETAGYDSDPRFAGLTACANGSCIPFPDPLTLNWLKIFVLKDSTWTPRNITRTDFKTLIRKSIQEYSSIMAVGTDLSAFQARGGKIITYHGMSDPIVTAKNTIRYYRSLTTLPNTTPQSFYRLFLAPGLAHGVGGRGAYPHSTWQALVDWVEKGIAPERLEATSMPNAGGKKIYRVLCVWPKKSVYEGGDVNDFGSWGCV